MPRFTPGGLDDAGWSTLLTGALVPRPIAWITTRSPSGVVNLAPFSFVTVAATAPPTLAVSIAHRNPVKDTLRNLRDTGEAVVHLVPASLAAAANASSAPYPPDTSEPAALGLDLGPMPPLAVPRLAAADIALACRLERILPIGAPSAHLVLLTVVAADIAGEVAGADGLPDAQRFRAWARLGGSAWLAPDTWRLVHMPRPRSIDASSETS